VKAKNIITAAIAAPVVAGAGVALWSTTASAGTVHPSAAAQHGAAAVQRSAPAAKHAAAASKHAADASKKATARDGSAVQRHGRAGHGARLHVIKPGDTLSALAGQANGRYGTHITWQAIFEANHGTRHFNALTDPNTLRAGATIRIPSRDWWAGRYHAPAAPASASPAAAAPATDGMQASGSGQDAVQQAPAAPAAAAGAPGSFQACVATRESGNNPHVGPAGLYGILPSTWQSLGLPGTAGEASVAQQNAAFNQLYARDGASPWAQYDGC
jgi:nucleoid-associated protein YgaU